MSRVFMLLRCVLVGHLCCICMGLVVGTLGYSLSWNDSFVIAVAAPAGIIAGLGGVMIPLLNRHRKRAGARIA